MEDDNPIECKSKKVALSDSFIESLKAYLSSTGFPHKIIGDTPTDNNQLTPRKYVTLNGNTINRPTSKVIGQFYLDTQINKPIWYNGTNWIDATGSIV